MKTAFPSWVVDAIARGNVQTIIAAPAPVETAPDVAAPDTASVDAQPVESTISAATVDAPAPVVAAPVAPAKRPRKGRGKALAPVSNANADMLLPCDIPELECHPIGDSLSIVGIDD